MRITIIGGTEFIGRRTVELLTERGDDVMVVHRGKTEPADLPPCEHVHVERAAFASVAADVTAFRPDAIVDTIASSAADRDAVLPHLPDVPLVVLSSMDVYRFFELLHADDDTPLPVPFDESGELRRGRYPYAGRGIGEDDYEKLDVEPAYLERGASVLRLAMVYGPRDPQTREEFVLRRVRAGRDRIPSARPRRSSLGSTWTMPPPRSSRPRPARRRRGSGVQHRRSRFVQHAGLDATHPRRRRTRCGTRPGRRRRHPAGHAAHGRAIAALHHVQRQGDVAARRGNRRRPRRPLLPPYGGIWKIRRRTATRPTSPRMTRRSRRSDSATRGPPKRAPRVRTYPVWPT